MKKQSKKILSFLMIISIFITTMSFPAASTDVTINISDNPKLDIVLTTKNKSSKLSNFEADVKEKLQENGIDTKNITFQTSTMEVITTDTKSTSAKEIFNNWTLFPYNSGSAGGWSYVDTPDSTGLGGYIVSTINPSFETGFLDTQKGQVSNVELNSILHPGEVSQPVGYLVRWHPQSEGSDYYDGYMLWVSGGNEGDAGARGHRYICLFKIEGSNLNYSTMPNPYTSSPVNLRSSGGQLYFYHDISDNGYNWYQKIEVGTRVQNTKVSKTAFTLLGYYATTIPNYVPGTRTCAADDLLNLTLKAKDDNLIVLLDNNEIINVTDSSYDTGYYGFWQSTSINPKFYNMNSKVEKISYKTYKEVLNAPTWREDAKHVIINVDDEIDNTIIGEEYIGEVLSKTLNDEIHFIQWGSTNNKASMENFILQNNNKGKFINNSNYENSINETVEYILQFYEIKDNESQYITIGQDISFSVDPEEYKTNAISTDYPNGRWKINHEYKYFTNNQGQSSESGVPTTDLNFNFDKPGKYNILFDDKLVKEVYVHRKPVADFTIEIGENNSLILNSLSYDLDSNENKGIAKETWYYKEASASEWIEGKLTEFDKTKIYVIKLEVEDYQGVTSYTTKYTGTGNPVSNFNYANNVVSKYKPLVINNTSYDPEGYEIVEQNWILKKDDVLISTTSEPITDFNQDGLGEGKYTYTLTVKNSQGTVSEAFTKSFTIEEDYGKPEVAIGQQGCDWKHSQAVSLEFSDNESEFKNWRYVFSTSPVAPEDGWSDWSEETDTTIQLADVSGKYYLHIEAYDIANNSLTRAVGTYNLDNTDPVINDIKTQKDEINKTFIKVEATDEHSGIVGYAITKAEPMTFNLRARTAVAIPTEFQESNILEVIDNGTYNVWTKDAAGNITSTVYTIEDVNYIGKNTTVYAEVGYEFKVTIPKHIILSGTTKSGAYTVSVEGDIAGTDKIKVIPDESFALKSTNLNDVTATIEQDKTEWSYDQILNDEFKVIGNGSINASGITAGSWNGNFNFNIVLEGDKIYKNSEPFVEYIDILYDYEINENN